MLALRANWIVAVSLLLPLVTLQAQSADPVQVSTASMDEILATDAQGWMFNKYDRGSMRGVQVVSQDGDAVVLRGEYSFNRGKVGWVKITFKAGRVTCLEFWDFQGNCRKLGRSPSQAIVMGALAIVAVGTLTSGSGRSGNNGERPGDSSSGTRETYIYRPYEAPQPQPDPPKTPPIGGPGGLYGCASPPCM